MPARSCAAVLLAGALASTSAFGAVYRCEAEGRVTYSDRACSAFAPTAELPKLSIVAPDPASAGLGAALLETARQAQAQRIAEAARAATAGRLAEEREHREAQRTVRVQRWRRVEPAPAPVAEPAAPASGLRGARRR